MGSLPLAGWEFHLGMSEGVAEYSKEDLLHGEIWIIENYLISCRRQVFKAEGRLSAVSLFALWHLYRRARRDATALRLKLLSILGTTSSSIRMADLGQGRLPALRLVSHKSICMSMAVKFYETCFTDQGLFGGQKGSNIILARVKLDDL